MWILFLLHCLFSLKTLDLSVWGWKIGLRDNRIYPDWLKVWVLHKGRRGEWRLIVFTGWRCRDSAQSRCIWLSRQQKEIIFDVCTQVVCWCKVSHLQRGFGWTLRPPPPHPDPPLGLFWDPNNTYHNCLIFSCVAVTMATLYNCHKGNPRWLHFRISVGNTSICILDQPPQIIFPPDMFLIPFATSRSLQNQRNLYSS